MKENSPNVQPTGGLALVADVSTSVVITRFGDSVLRIPMREGRQVAFSKGGSEVLWWSRASFLDMRGKFVITDLNGERLSAGAPNRPGFHPVILSETGRRIAFRAAATAQIGVRAALYWSSYDVSIGGLVHDLDVSVSPDWSPDGTQLVYDHQNEVFVYDLQSGSSRSITSGRNPSWSPDGNKIAYVGEDGRAYIMSLTEGHSAWPLAERMPLGQMRWSPDGKYVAFSARSKGILGHYADLIVCRVEDGNAAIVRGFGSESADYLSYFWILDYRKLITVASKLA